VRSMRSRLGQLFNWKRVVRVAGGITLVGGTVVGISTVSLAAASCYTINRIRPRTYTDDYHLNPEILRMPYRNVEFSTEDGVTLKGWWIPATVHGHESNRIVVLMHPYDNHKSNLLGVASSLWYHGCSVFMFDFRSFAANPKTRQTIGYLEQFDATAAVNYVKNNHYINPHITDDDDIYKRRQIVLMGASMGGAVAILTAYKFKDMVSAIVTDCAFSSLRDICKFRIAIASSMWFPTGLLDTVVNIMDIGNQFIYGYTVDEVAPSEIVNKQDFDIPLLLLHSECDAAVPFAHSQTLYKRAQSKIKNLYCVKSGDHCGAYFINPKLYAKYITQWVDDVLDHEILEKKQKRKSQSDEPSKEDNNVVINNDFIMFDTQDEIGLEPEDLHQGTSNDGDSRKDNDSTSDHDGDESTNEMDQNAEIIVNGTSDASSSASSSSSSSSLLSYFGFKK